MTETALSEVMAVRLSGETKAAVYRKAKELDIKPGALIRFALGLVISGQASPSPQFGPRFGDSQHKPILEVAK